jgi:hypothetical protein
MYCTKKINGLLSLVFYLLFSNLLAKFLVFLMPSGAGIMAQQNFWKLYQALNFELAANICFRTRLKFRKLCSEQVFKVEFVWLEMNNTNISERCSGYYINGHLYIGFNTNKSAQP